MLARAGLEARASACWPVLARVSLCWRVPACVGACRLLLARAGLPLSSASERHGPVGSLRSSIAVSVCVGARRPVLAHVTRMLARVAACRPVLMRVSARCRVSVRAWPGLCAPPAPEHFFGALGP